MPRPARPQWKTRRYARRRHRTWMYSMTLASFGWGVWWVWLFWRRIAPDSAPGLQGTGWLGGGFATLGLVFAVLTIRAGRTWLLFVVTAILANVGLLLLPWVISGLP